MTTERPSMETIHAMITCEKPHRRHHEDCHIYASLVNGTPLDGICTCGYALEVMRATGETEQFYSKERREA